MNLMTEEEEETNKILTERTMWSMIYVLYVKAKLKVCDIKRGYLPMNYFSKSHLTA